MSEICIIPFSADYEEKWDDFVLNKSINGNFLQTRNFLNYHPKDRFKDSSVLFLRNSEIVAVIPANEVDGGNTLLAHQGSTYGGLIVGKKYASSQNYDQIFDEMLGYFKNKGYKNVALSMHNWLYSPDVKHNELLDYYFQLYGFSVRSEIGFFINLSKIGDNYETEFEKLKRRKLGRARSNGLSFRKITEDCEVSRFYEVLSDNMKKFDTTPTHTLEEILEIKNNRLPDVTSFYGVFYEDKMIAGSMVWNFCNKKVFHTQYLASLHDCLELCPNEFLYSSLIKEARSEGYRYLSFGTANYDHGNAYNESLGMYKEGFNTDSYINRCYIWRNED